MFPKGVATFTTGSTTVSNISMSSGDIASVARGTRLDLGGIDAPNNILEAIDRSISDNTIELREPFTGATAVYSFKITYTGDGFREAAQAMRDTRETLLNLYEDADTNPTGGSLALRDVNGNVKTGEPIADDDAVSKSYLQNKLQLTTSDLISGNNAASVGTVITTTGFYTAGDSGGAQWKATSTTGLTPSQTPADRGTAELVDGSGRLWVLVSTTIDARALGDNYGKSIAIAVSSGIPVEINEKVTATIDSADVDSVMQGINLIIGNRELTIKIPAGEHAMSDFVDFTNYTGNNIVIDGEQTNNVTVNSINVISNASYNHIIELDAPSHGLEEGQYFYVNVDSLSGTGRFKEIAGCWKITSVINSSTIRIKHTHAEPTFPTMTASFTIRPLKTILRWSGTRGFSVSGVTLKQISNVCLAGDFDISTEAPSDGAIDGFQVGDEANTEETGSTLSESHFSGSAFCRLMGIVEWRNNGVQVLGGSLKTSGFSVSSCGHRAIQAGGNGTIETKFSAAVGNASSGYEAEASGSVEASGSIAAGNGEQGAYAIGSGHIVFSTNAYSGGNLTYGLDARDNGFIAANTAEVGSNAIGAINANFGGVTLEFGVINGAVSAAIDGAVQMQSSSGSVTVTKDSSSTVIMFSGKEFGGWNEFTPTLSGVTYTDNSSIGYFREDGGVAHFSVDLNFTGLDTADSSVIFVQGFPSTFAYSYGQATINNLASDGYVLPVSSTFDAEINTSASRGIIITDSSGAFDKYNGGRIQASGRLVVSGWVKTEF